MRTALLRDVCKHASETQYSRVLDAGKAFFSRQPGVPAVAAFSAAEETSRCFTMALRVQRRPPRVSPKRVFCFGFRMLARYRRYFSYFIFFFFNEGHRPARDS